MALPPGGAGRGPPAGPFTRLPTPGLAGYNVAWSPFYPDKLAVAGAANYGLVGNGKLNVIGLVQQGAAGPPGMRIERGFDTQDGLYDLAWSEAHENQVATASGDGSIKLWDISLAEPHPIRHWHEHAREVFSLDWNNVRKDVFASSSWDASVRVWHPERPSCMTAITSHTACVYGCAWSPHSADLLATACGDGHLRLFDLRSSTMTSAAPGVGASQAPVATVPVGGEVLSLDWNKYRPMTLATGSTDRAVKVWDLRALVAASASSPGQPAAGGAMGPANTAIMMGHEYAVRKVAWSPHRPNVLASASYDMSARVWDVDAGEKMAAGPLVGAGPRSLTAVHDAHTEFVVGLAWSLFQEGLVATCAWDCEAHLWAAR